MRVPCFVGVVSCLVGVSTSATLGTLSTSMSIVNNTVSLAITLQTLPQSEKALDELTKLPNSLGVSSECGGGWWWVVGGGGRW